MLSVTAKPWRWPRTSGAQLPKTARCAVSSASRTRAHEGREALILTYVISYVIHIDSPVNLSRLLYFILNSALKSNIEWFYGRNGFSFYFCSFSEIRYNTFFWEFGVCVTKNFYIALAGVFVTFLLL